MKTYQAHPETNTASLCEWLMLPRSSVYYKAHPGPKGIKPSTHTLFKGESVGNDQVIEEIKSILQGPYTAYGYHQTCTELKELGYAINHKKVYRLMDECKLLLGKKIRTKGRREYVKFRRINARRPMEHLCLDIKYIWVAADGRWYYLLSIMDVYSRFILIWTLQSSLTQHDVIGLMRKLHLLYNLKSVIIRNDNGSQFIAHKVRNFLKDLEAKQEFTHVATPEENAYIESFHSIMQRELIDRYQFESYYDAKVHIENYMWWYNYKRRHQSIGNVTPCKRWAQGLTGATIKQLKKAADKMMLGVDKSNQMKLNYIVPSLYQSKALNGLELLNQNQSISNHYTQLNPKTVQLIGG
jgi:putative transposase